MTTTDFETRETTYEEQGGGSSDGYARIYWMNGEPRDGTPGRFWAQPDRLESNGVTVDKPWGTVEHTFSDGNKKQLVMARALRVAPIVWRQQNYIKDEKGGVADWIAHPTRGKLPPNQGVCFEMLCFVEGLNVPVVFSTKAIKSSMAWLINILPEHRKMRDAVKESRGGKTVPPWWFWLPIRSAIDPQTKKPIYEKTPGRPVTPPIWVPPGDIAIRDTWVSLYVGNELADLGEQVYVSGGRDWASTPISSSYQLINTSESADRNVPQPIEEEAPF